MERYPDIITANGTGGVYYTRGCWLPVDNEYSVSFAAQHQDKLQDLYTGGANFNVYLREPIHDWRSVRSLAKKIVTNTKLPFISISPAISVCPVCGKTEDNRDYCQHDLTEEQIKDLKARGVEIED